jgi:hypothetical protein
MYDLRQLHLTPVAEEVGPAELQYATPKRSPMW